MSASAADPTDFAATRSAASSRAGLVYRVLCVIAFLALGASYFQPAWWVALRAPNYPVQTFPDGVRINFHVDRVSNGCVLRKNAEVTEKEALDCVHEMDTINHFVGMFPIASGGPVEKLFSPFLFSFLGVLIIGFALPGSALRMGVMALGFAAIAAWMSLALFTPNGVQYLGKGWVAGLVDSLGRSEDETKDDAMHPVVRQLKESLARSGLGEIARPKVDASAGKAQLIEILKTVHDQKAPVSLTDSAPEWTGAGLDVMAWHYAESLGRWFNEPVKNGRLVRIMTNVAWLLYGAILVAMLAFLWIAARPRSTLFYALALAPMLLPIGFVAEYAGWLWWYGHSLNEMGAFTLKPFMPTVFGDGKVAQFSTHSYPSTGFALMAVVGLAMAAAILTRRNMPEAEKR